MFFSIFFSSVTIATLFTPALIWDNTVFSHVRRVTLIVVIVTNLCKMLFINILQCDDRHFSSSIIVEHRHTFYSFVLCYMLHLYVPVVYTYFIL